MFRRLLPIFALIALLASPLSSVAAASPEAIAADINAYWQGQLGAGYSPPNFVAVPAEGLSTGCGPIDPSFGPGAYCPLDATVYWSPTWSDGDSYIWYVILSHEWVHHIQHLQGAEGAADQQKELQADCGAGAYVKDAETRGFAEPGTFNKGMGLAINAGDLPFYDDGFSVHGSGADRGTTIMNGYMNGLSACGF